MRRECPKTTYSPPRHPHRAQRCHIHHLNIILYHTVYRAQTRSALEKQERVSGTWLWLRKWFGDGNAKDHLDFVAMGARPIRHREFTRRCFMELRASESVSIESNTGFAK